MTKNVGDFKSKWAHRRLSCSEHAIQLPLSTHFNNWCDKYWLNLKDICDKRQDKKSQTEN